MRSALYECRIVHERFTPKQHRFAYRVFAFALDLDEIDALVARIPWLSRNRFNLYSFHDRDHLDIRELVRAHGITQRPHRVQLITNLRILGYVFNPVSFYFCFDETGEPIAAVAEVNNTFGETKPYVIGASELRGDRSFESRRRKEFYISPFVDLEVDLLLRLAVPDRNLGIVITDIQDGETVLEATMTGSRVPLTAGRLAWFTVKYPLLTLKVIAAIHWQALRLWLKGVPFHRKSEGMELQRGMALRKEGTA
ncbi:MAG: DUF1365 domain-containing protein [Thermoanaerobaculia bacterium]